MVGPSNSINQTTTGLVGFTSTAFVGSPATQHCVQIGGATSSTLANVTNGTTGQFLGANTGAAPTFQSLSVGSLSFFYYLNAEDANVTGDGTNYRLGTTDYTSLFDNSGGAITGDLQFTAPATGVYVFTLGLQIYGLLVAHTSVLYQLYNTTSGQGVQLQCNPFTAATSGVMGLPPLTQVASMTSGQVMQFYCQVSGGTKVVDLAGVSSGWFRNYVCGYRIA